MAQKDTLYKLIKSLAHAEKSYVVKKLNSAEKNESLFFLYSILNNQKELDEDVIKKKYAKKYDLKTLPIHKNKLYEAILQWLVDLNQTHSIENIVAALFAKLDIMISKSLYTEALREIENIEEIADKHQLPLVKINVLDRYMKLMFDVPTGTYDYDVILKKIEEQQNSLQEYTTYTEIIALRISLNKVMFKLSSGNEQKNKYAALDKALEKPNTNDLAFLAPRLNYLHSKGLIQLMQGNSSEALVIYKQLVDCFGTSIELIERYSENYLSAYHNIAMCYLQLRNEKEALNTINKIKHTESKNIHLSYRIKERYIINIQNYYLIKKEYTILNAIGNEYENDLMSNYFLYRATLYVPIALNFCVSCLMQQEYKKALKWSNQLINNKFSVTYDSLSHNRLINLIIHYELKNLDYIESVIVSYEKYLVKICYYHPFHKEVIVFFKNIIHENNSLEIKKQFDVFSKKLNAISSTNSFNEREIINVVLDWINLRLK